MKCYSNIQIAFIICRNVSCRWSMFVCGCSSAVVSHVPRDEPVQLPAETYSRLSSDGEDDLDEACGGEKPDYPYVNYHPRPAAVSSRHDNKVRILQFHHSLSVVRALLMIQPQYFSIYICQQLPFQPLVLCDAAMPVSSPPSLPSLLPTSRRYLWPVYLFVCSHVQTT